MSNSLDEISQQEDGKMTILHTYDVNEIFHSMNFFKQAKITYAKFFVTWYDIMKKLVLIVVYLIFLKNIHSIGIKFSLFIFLSQVEWCKTNSFFNVNLGFFLT